ncbi:MAG: ATP synthase subunit I [Pyrinomonadaceae bacterium]
MGLVPFFMAVVSAVFLPYRFSIGVLIGGAFAYLNYFWLKKTLQHVFLIASEGETPRIFGAGYILRYIAFGLFLAIIYVTDIVPIGAVIFGLASFAFAIVIEGFLRIFSTFNNR